MTTKDIAITEKLKNCVLVATYNDADVLQVWAINIERQQMIADVRS